MLEFNTVTTGVYSGDEYLCFQRHEVHGHDDDDGIYIEYKDQLYSGENCIESVCLTEDRLAIKLSSNLFKLEDVDEFIVDLHINSDEFVALRNGLKFTFWDCSEKLEIGA